jgi:nitrate/nitrite transporter NarK
MNKAHSENQPIILPYAWVILLVVYLASIAGPLNQSKVPPLMPVIMEAFTLTLSQAGWLMSVFALIGLILALPAGVLLQKYGPRSVGITALVSLTLGASLGALASTPTVLLASRVLEGAGMGLIAVVAPAAIAIWFPAARQGTPMGLWATWVPVGTILMALLAPALALAAGWQAVWWLTAGFSLLVLVVYAALMRMPPRPAGATSDHAPSLPLRQALANRQIWLLCLQFGCFNLVFLPLATFYPTFLADVRGFSLPQAAFVASISTIVVLVSAPLAGVLSDRIGSRRLVYSIPFLFIGVLMLFPYTATGWQIYAVMILLGLFAGAIPTATFAAAPELMARPELAGLGLAVVILGQNLGMFVGPILFGALVEALGWATAGYWMIPVCLVGFAAGWIIKAR